MADLLVTIGVKKKSSNFGGFFSNSFIIIFCVFANIWSEWLQRRKHPNSFYLGKNENIEMLIYL